MSLSVEDMLAADSIRKSQVEFLVRAETAEALESQLDQILQRVDDAVISWEKVGDMVNNAVIAEVTDNMTGVVENLTNASDAYLLQQYDGGSYKNSHEAADALLDDETITMRFEGNKGKGRGSNDFSIAFADAAHGQPAENFDVFVDPFASGVSKQEYPFLQGCRGIGAMTALSHTDGGHKFIASASDGAPEEWMWTVIRRGSDGDYYYLTIDGEFPSFTGELDCGEGIGAKRQGTVVKLYNYNLATNPDNAAGGSVFRRRLSRYLPDPVVPIEIVDARYDNDNQTTYTGVRDAVEERSDAFHNRLHTTKDVLGVGEVELDVYVGKESKMSELKQFFTSQNDDRVLVTLNGQSHARYSKADLKSEAELQNVGSQMLVLARLLDSVGSVGDDMFNTARDGFSDSTKGDMLLNAVYRALREHDGLQELDERLAASNEDTTEEAQDDAVEEPTTMRIDTQRVATTVGSGAVTVPLSFNAPAKKVVNDEATTITTPAPEYSVELQTEDGEATAVVSTDEQKTAGVTDTVTLIGRFEDGTAAPQVAIAYEAPEAQDDEYNEEEKAFSALLDTEELHPVHEQTLATLENYDVADIAYDLLEQHADTDVLSNIEAIVRTARPRVEQRAAAKGKNVSQASRAAVGSLFETLVYVSLVDRCEEAGYIVRHEPAFSDLAGIDGDGVKPDMDIVIEEQEADTGPLYIFSLKTSLRERIGQSLFWKVLLDLSMCDCSDESCIANKSSHEVLTTNERDAIKYGYITLGWSRGGNTGVLDRFDMGYIPSQNMGDDVPSQMPLSQLLDDLEDGWA